MITLRRSSERHHVHRAQRQGWSSFHAERSGDAFAHGFGVLACFEEHRLAAKANLVVHPPPGIDVVSYVLAGVLASRHSSRQTAILRAGDFQRASGGASGELRQSNMSPSHEAHFLQLWLRHGTAQPAPLPEQRRFSVAERRGNLCLIASGVPNEAALRLHEDVSIYSSVLDPGQHLVHELAARRSAWLHVVQGEVSCDDNGLHSGDAASFALERSVSMTARVPSEVLLVDLAHLASAAPI